MPRTTRKIGEPEPGFFKRRLVKGGPWVSVRFFLDDGEMRVEVDGQTHHQDGRRYDPDEEWVVSWPSDEAEFRFLTRLREWAQQHAPHHPAARPRQRIDLGTMPPRTRP